MSTNWSAVKKAALDSPSEVWTFTATQIVELTQQMERLRTLYECERTQRQFFESELSRVTSQE